MASSGLETLREVVQRSSQEGRLRVDLALYQQERRELFAEIGQPVLGLVDAQQLELPVELTEVVARLRNVESYIQMDSARVHDNAFGDSRGYEPEAGGEDLSDQPEPDGDPESESESEYMTASSESSPADKARSLRHKRR